uniref:Endoplasmic reticulum transmembrane protein n=1 Tax=Eutreptiella gymnastica TaxID=73025 RepID=A0A7S1NFZ1_9EUGL|mmetsp:Transcript_32556/g.58398  ORF Transcript_32556/g.58398 Transcript_32556/m.58398 type:complete len:154 (+) Transcript_32556:89-550(+)
MLAKAMFGVMLAEATLVVILIMPTTNTMRGHMVALSRWVWSSNVVRALVMAVLIMQGAVFFEAMRNIDRLDDRRTDSGITGEYYNYANLLRNQRNAYIAGFGLFLTFLIWRQLAILSHLYELYETRAKYEETAEYRAEMKAKESDSEHRPLLP